MKCCVPLCRNTGEDQPITVPVHHGSTIGLQRATITSLHINVLCGITFIRFPTTVSQRAAWLQMLGLTESDLPPGAAVCSEHFRRSDFTVTNDGVVKLNKDAIPLQFCMICLASGHSKMYPMSHNYLEKVYTSLTGIAVSYIRDKINTQPRVCVECAQRLVNCDRLRNKGLRAFKSLMQILGNGKILTLHNLKSINRVEKQLISNIAKHTFEPDLCDLYVNEEDNTIYSEEGYSYDIKGNIDMTRVKYEEKDATSDVVHLSESDDFQNDVYADNDINNDNKLYNDDIEITGIINNDGQVKNTNNNDDNTNYCDAGLTNKFDDDIMNSDVTDFTNNEEIVFMISDSADEVKSLGDDIEHDIDIDDDVEDGFVDNMNNYHNNGLLSKNYLKVLNRLKDENKSENRVSLSNIIFVKDSRPIIQNKDLIPSIDKTNNIQNEDKLLNNVKHEIAKSNNKKRPGKLTTKKNARQLSCKSKIVKASVPIPKTRKEPKPCGPKPKKRNSIIKLFTKTILTYEEQLADIQRRQHTKRYKSYPYKCDICFTGNWSIFTYNRHMEKHTDKHGKWECAICGLRKETRSRLKSHVLSHAERYSCKRCNYVTNCNDLLINHARWHSGLAFKCPHCEAEFSKRTSYFSHVRIKHPSDCACPLCGFSFVSKQGVNAHIKMSHRFEDVQNLSGPSCAQCNIRFASEAAYETHISVSPKHVSSGYIPRRNEKFYTRAEPQPDDTMDTVTFTSRKRRRRTRRDEGFEAPLCDICGKSFRCAFLLIQHLNVHAGVKPYSCNVCHKEFTNYSNRRRHMLTHDPKKRPWYTCDICNKSFTTLGSKVNHVAHVHNKVPWPKRHRPQRRARKQEYSEDDGDSHDVSDA